MSPEPAGTGEPEGRIEEALADVLEARERGLRLSFEALAARYPDLPAADLYQELVAQDVVQCLLRESSADGGPTGPLEERALPRPPEPGSEESEPSFPAARSLGDYDLLGVLGEGGMGTVYRAVQRITGRDVAVKVLPPALAAHFRRTERFQREIHVAASLQHPGIVQVLAAGEEDGCLYYAMELVHGADLGRILEHRAGKAGQDGAAGQALASPAVVLQAGRAAFEGEAGAAGWRRSPGGLGPDRAVLVWWLAQVARALHYAHQEGVVHRDVKPSNILVDRSGRARIADFGLARPAGMGTLLTLGSAGTPAYMSPEQAAGARGWTGPATDIYSLGATLYHAVTGRLPFGDEDTASSRTRRLRLPAAPRSVAHGVPRDLQAVILRAMDPDPRHRHPTAAALADDLEAFLRGAPVWARPLPWPLRAWRRVRRNPRTTAVAAAGLLLTAGVAGTFEWRANARLAMDLGRGRTYAAECNRLLGEGRPEGAELLAHLARDTYLSVHAAAGWRRQAAEALRRLAHLYMEQAALEPARAVYGWLGDQESRDGVTALLESPGPMLAPLPASNSGGAFAAPASIHSFLLRQRVVEEVALPTFSGSLLRKESVLLADVLASSAGPGRDGVAEVVFHDWEGRVLAWDRAGIHLLTPPLFGEECLALPEGTAKRCSLIPALAALPGEDRWLLAVLRDRTLRLFEETADGFRESQHLPSELVVDLGDDTQDHGLLGKLVLGRGRAGIWAAIATEGWKGGDKARRDWVVDLRTGHAERLDEGEYDLTYALAAVDVDADGSDEILAARGEWRGGYSLALHGQDPGGKWQLRRSMRLGRLTALAPCGAPWFLLVKNDWTDNEYFDKQMESGIPRGIYPVRLGAGPLDPPLQIPAGLADLRLPLFWDHVQTPASAALAGGGRLILVPVSLPQLNTGVLLAYEWPSGSAQPDLSGPRQLFFWRHPDGPPALLAAGNLDGDGEEEILASLGGHPLIFGWDD